eukprot:TRINITY_DN16614_c0_g1_i2.p1 TRINITY_DN16614_c0_g1~~TRINITY_DN16614_c0_g1_i2.p1  ORF type:complete len:225 (-),score=58.99 TRINITY_DN16614_c0_g1_i2:67-741(-)
MCIRDRYQRRVRGTVWLAQWRDRATTMPKIPTEAAKALTGYLGLFAALFAIAVELGIGVPGVIMHQTYSDTPCQDADLLMFLQGNGILGCASAAMLVVLVIVGYNQLLEEDLEDNSSIVRSAVVSGCGLCSMVLCHVVLLLIGTVDTYSSSCRAETPALYHATTDYLMLCWVLLLGEPLMLGACIWMGAGIDIKQADAEHQALRDSAKYGQRVPDEVEHLIAYK